MTFENLLAPVAVVVGTLVAGSALADPAAAKALVDAAKTDGIVGEQADGFLGWVKPSGDAGLKAAVAEINAGRAQLYTQAAARNAVTPAAAGAAAYLSVIRGKLRPGDYYQTPDGAWVRK